MRPRELLQPRPNPQPSFNPIPNDPSGAAAAAASGEFDSSSMAITALVLVSALFFLGFLSIFARRFFSGRRSVALYHRPPIPRLSHQPSGYAARAACVGLDAETLRSLPLLTFTGGGGTAWCVVCLGEFEEKETVKLIPRCGHVFHPVCIDAWLGLHGSCPLCRCSEIVGFGVRGGDVRLDLREGCADDGGGGQEGNQMDDGGGGGGGDDGDDDEEEEEEEEGDEEMGNGEREGKRMVGLGRSRSGDWRRVEERTMFLRRSCSF